MTGEAIRFGHDRLSVVLGIDPDRPVRVDSLDVAGRERTDPGRQPLVELLALGEGRALNSTRYTDTAVGARLRHRSHRERADGAAQVLEVEQSDPVTGLRTVTSLRCWPGVAAVQVRTEVVNDGDDEQILQMVSSLALGAVLDDGEDLTDVVLHRAATSWCAESRWSTTPLAGSVGLGRITAERDTGQSRSFLSAVSTSTWSTGEVLPTAVLANEATGRALAWQIEHNGAWRWEVDARWVGGDEIAVILAGPDDTDHHWTHRLRPGDRFVSVPVSVAVSREGYAGALGELTRQRRAQRRPLVRPDLPVIFNDYMNTLWGDPTTAKLLPLVDAAAGSGAEYFCIDAGWYDDGGNWWPSVGEWQPSTTRFPDGGLQRVLDHIVERGMRPGLWVEPEVVGVRSPVAETLPEAAFLQRHGRRVVEQDRYFLDLRHPAARAHLDEVVDRLVGWGAEFFKFDYNVTPGAGTDREAFSVGQGLLEQNRAQLDWLDGVRDRHPRLVIENCSSGAMRMDYALMSRLELQSTSDQTSPVLYAPIAAAAPASLAPEQAGNWAYPQHGTPAEEIALCLVNGLAGRLYLSGHLDAMDAAERALVEEGVAAYVEIRDELGRSLPSWPLGLPSAPTDAVALALRTEAATLLYVWCTGPGAHAELELDLPGCGPGTAVSTVYPRSLPAWEQSWDAAAGRLRLRPGLQGPTARVFRVG